MHNILITGSNGQLGNEIKTLAKDYLNYHYFFTDKDDLDITNIEDINNYMQQHNIHIIINCAAYTNVDKAEREIKLADEINHIGAKNLAILSKKYNLKLVHISTDYVFDGTNFKPYVENDKTHPINIYGKTKFAGENSILKQNLNNSIIIRTSWVYSSFGNNFVKTMLELGREKQQLDVIFDQIGTPTYAKDLAKVILEILPKIDNNATQIYNYSNEGVASWYDFAKEIMSIAKLDCEILPIEGKDYKTAAKRPFYSVLNKNKIKQDFGVKIPHWKESLQKCIKQIEKESNA
jgi:dTDP-4-dehydrorhamnose reductase